MTLEILRASASRVGGGKSGVVELVAALRPTVAPSAGALEGLPGEFTQLTRPRGRVLLDGGRCASISSLALKYSRFRAGDARAARTPGRTRDLHPPARLVIDEVRLPRPTATMPRTSSSMSSTTVTSGSDRWSSRFQCSATVFGRSKTAKSGTPPSTNSG